MLIKLNPLACAADLTTVLRIMERLFEAVAEVEYSPDSPIPEGINTDHDFQALFRYRRIREGVLQLLGLSPKVRRELADAFANDARFDERIEDASFHFKFRGLPENVLAVAENVLVALYDDILSQTGFRGLQGQSSPQLNRRTFEDDYRVANSDREFVCSGCLGKLERPAGEFVMTDCEHFFPQKRYPALVVHPLNLVILCTTCNQRAHRSTLPIGEHAGAIRETFIPYIRPGLDEIDLVFRPGQRVASVQLEGKASDPLSARRVANFDAVYLLSPRWTNNLSIIHTSLIDDIVERYPERTLGNVAEFLREKAYMRLDAQLRTPDAFLRSHYASWVLENRLDLFVATLN